MLAKGKEGATRMYLLYSGCLFQSRQPNEWEVLACVAQSGLGQKDLTEVSLHLLYGEEQGDVGMPATTHT